MTKACGSKLSHALSLRRFFLFVGLFGFDKMLVEFDIFNDFSIGILELEYNFDISALVYENFLHQFGKQRSCKTFDITVLFETCHKLVLFGNTVLELLCRFVKLCDFLVNNPQSFVKPFL